MFERILVAIDGSDSADKAFTVAADLAKQYGAELALVYAATSDQVSEAERRLAESEHLADSEDLRTLKPLEGMATDGTYPLPNLLDHSHYVGLKVRMALGQRLLARYREQAEEKGVKVISADVEDGAPDDVIIDKAKAVGADAIAMGSRGFSDLKGLVVGSTSHKVSSRAPCSVLTMAA